jgi:hypothetical protein
MVRLGGVAETQVAAVQELPGALTPLKPSGWPGPVSKVPFVGSLQF